MMSSTPATALIKTNKKDGNPVHPELDQPRPILRRFEENGWSVALGTAGAQAPCRVRRRTWDHSFSSGSGGKK